MSTQHYRRLPSHPDCAEKCQSGVCGNDWPCALLVSVERPCACRFDPQTEALAGNECLLHSNLRAALTAERERADRAERDCNGLSLDVQTLTAERDELRERVDGLAQDAERYRLARKICSFRFTCRNSMRVDLYDALEALFDALEDATAAEYAEAADKTLDAALAALGDK